MNTIKYQKDITAYGRKMIMACDGKCDKAWGMNSREAEYNDRENDPDNYEYFTDDEVGIAPEDPGTYEGGYGKPHMVKSDDMNKWCFRECERCSNSDNGDLPVLPDFSVRSNNIPGELPYARPSK